MYEFFFSLKNNSKKYFLSKNVINLTFQLLEVVNIQTREICYLLVLTIHYLAV
jgi:hypothetical protein